MYYTLKTTIGDVFINCGNRSISVSARETALETFTIDEEADNSGLISSDMSIDDSFFVVAPILRDKFPHFLVVGIGDFGAPMEKLFESQLVQALSLLNIRDIAA